MQPPRRALIVAAHAGLRGSTSRWLSRAGFVAQPCSTVQEAQAALELELVAVVHLGLSDGENPLSSA